jgi:hypothetical protein
MRRWRKWIFVDIAGFARPPYSGKLKGDFYMKTWKHFVFVVIIFFMFIGVITNIVAEEREGIIIRKLISSYSLGGENIIFVYVDTDRNKIPDHIIWYYEFETKSPVGGLMDSLLEQGTKISFDNEAHRQEWNGLPAFSRDSLLTIDDIPVTEWFPNATHLFPNAAKKVELKINQ